LRLSVLIIIRRRLSSHTHNRVFWLAGRDKSRKYRGKEVKFNWKNTSEQQRSKSTGTKKMWLSIPTKMQGVVKRRGVDNFVCMWCSQSFSLRTFGRTFFCRWLPKEEKILVVDMFKSLVRSRDILHTLKQRNKFNVSTIRTVYNARKEI